MGSILKNKQKSKRVFTHENRSHRYDINGSRSRQRHKYTKDKRCLNIMMLICVCVCVCMCVCVCVYTLPPRRLLPSERCLIHA